MPEGMRIFSGSAHKQLAEDVCQVLGVSLGDYESFKFSDGNWFVRIRENVRGCDIFFIQPICEPVNDNLVELLFTIDAFRRASAQQITAVIPYLSYARGDKKDQPRVSIRARVVADLLEAVGVQRVITLDLHSPQLQGFFKIPVDNLYAMPVFIEFLRKQHKDFSSWVVVSPDMGFAKQARKFAHRLGVSVAIGDKERVDHSEQAEIMNIIGDVGGKNALIVDDEVVSGGSLCKIAEALKDRGAREIYACVTHAVLSGKALEEIAKALIRELIVTDTIPLPKEKHHPKIVQISVAPLLARAIASVFQQTSISCLFE